MKRRLNVWKKTVSKYKAKQFNKSIQINHKYCSSTYANPSNSGMYFEFEITNSGETDGSQLSNSKSNSNGTYASELVEKSAQPINRSISPRKNEYGSSFSSSSLLSQSPSRSSFLSPLTSTPMSAQLHRRYSIHSGSTPFTLNSLPDNENVTFCDLALITKKKILQLNYNYAKGLNEEISQPDVKLNPTLCKHSNKDLRREVLLASIQRSLSVSSDDLSFSPSTCKINELNAKESSDINKNYNESEDLPMEVASNSTKGLLTNYKAMPSICSNISTDEIMGDYCSSVHELKGKSPISRIRARRSLNSTCYTPMENQNNCMNSTMTFTSTTSMAGSKNGGNHCRNFMSKKLNQNSLNLINNGMGNYGNSSTGNYYSNSASPKMTITVSSSLENSLKKRIHSSSPSKYSSPYHTISNSVCKDFNLIFANASSPFLSEWDMAFKRLKVMHCNMESNEADNLKEDNHIDRTEQMVNTNLSLPQYVSNNVQPEHDLNELAQDFHRLKTPFT
ncbi:hypothetical protein BLOT_014411 [Blomia tropicalis]|nr:hypothetical protein BLOT_014411 [Blomia tropicalis]